MQHSENLESNLRDLFEMLSKGLFVEAMEKYLHDDVVLREGNDVPKEGKDVCIRAEEEMLANVKEFIRYEVRDYAIRHNTTFYQAVMEYKEKGGKLVTVEQSVVSRWDDGKIISERFYHA